MGDTTKPRRAELEKTKRQPAELACRTPPGRLLSTNRETDVEPISGRPGIRPRSTRGGTMRSGAD